MAIIGNISREVADTANLHHGEILSFPFGNKSAPFAIMLLSKVGTDHATFPDLKISCRLIGDKVTSPFPINDLRDQTGRIWSERNIIFIENSQHSIDALARYRMFWVSGEYSPIE